jgi:hypothetical protein
MFKAVKEARRKASFFVGFKGIRKTALTFSALFLLGIRIFSAGTFILTMKNKITKG